MDRSAHRLKQAERDLAVAEAEASRGYHEWAAFAAQQCAEKAVKSLVESKQGAVRGHSVTEILLRIPASLAVPEGVLDAARELDQVYVTSRYPNGFVSGSPSDYFTGKTSQALIANARQILEFCRSNIR